MLSRPPTTTALLSWLLILNGRALSSNVEES
jgi:hypothetical protein